MTYEEALEYAKGYMTVEGVPISAHEATACIVKALEKQIPKKPYWEYGGYHCKLCGLDISEDDAYCSLCGQRIDWRDYE